MNPISIPALVMASVTFFVGTNHLLIYLKRRQMREDFTFSLTCFAIGFYDLFCAGLYSVDNVVAGASWQRLQIISLAFVSLTFLWFVADYTSLKSRRVVWGFSIFFIIAALAGIFTRNSAYLQIDKPLVKDFTLSFGLDITYFEVTPGPVIIVQTLTGITAFLYLVYITIQYQIHGNRRKAKHLLWAMALFLAGILNDTFVSNGIYKFIYLIEYSYLGIILVMNYSLMNLAIEAGYTKRALRETNETLNTILEAAPLPIYLLDNEGKVRILWNPAAEKILGWKKEEVLGKHLPTIISEEDKEGFRGIIKRLNNGESIDGLEVRRVRRDGMPIDNALYAAPLRDEHGEVTGNVAILLDITKRKRDELELTRYREHLEHLVDDRTRELKETHDKLIQSERLAILGQFSGNVSHEIRNPLAVIGSSVYYLKRRLETDDEKIREHLETIDGQIKLCTEIIESILNLTQMDEPSLKPVILQDVLREGVECSEVPYDIAVEWSMPSEPVKIQADYGQLRIAFKNVVLNAIQAMQIGGTLTVSLQIVENENGTSAEIRFADTGSGMDEEQLRQMFQPLYTTKARGIGLGLSIVKMIVDRHRGIISAESTPSEGTTIIFHLPCNS